MSDQAAGGPVVGSVTDAYSHLRMVTVGEQAISQDCWAAESTVGLVRMEKAVSVVRTYLSPAFPKGKGLEERGHE